MRKGGILHYGHLKLFEAKILSFANVLKKVIFRFIKLNTVLLSFCGFTESEADVCQKQSVCDSMIIIKLRAAYI